MMDKKGNSGFNSRIKTLLLKPLGILIVLCCIILLLFLVLIEIPYIQKKTAEKIAKAYGARLYSCQFGYDLHSASVSFTLKNVKIVVPSYSISFNLKSAQLNASYSDILSGKPLPDNIEIMQPEIRINNQSPESAGLTSEKIKSAAAPLATLFNSRVSGILKKCILKDGYADFNGMVFNGINAEIEQNPYDSKKTGFIFTTNIETRQENIPIKAHGEYINETKNITGISTEVSFGNIPVSILPLPDSFKGISGSVSSDMIEIDWKKGDSVHTKGSLDLHESGFLLNAYNELKSYSLNDTKLVFEAELTESAVDITDFQVRGKDFRVYSSCYIPVKNGLNSMSLCIRSSMMPMHRFKSLFPGPVTPTWISTRLLPLFSEGSAELKHMLMEGKFERISSLDLKENASSLFLDIDLDKINIEDFGGNLKSENISANILLDKGKLVISRVNGTIGKSTVKNAIYEYVDTYSDNSLENWYITGRFSLPDLHKISGSLISPEIVKYTAGYLISTKGTIAGDIRFSYHPSWKYIKISGGRIVSDGASLTVQYSPFSFDIKKLETEFTGNDQANIRLSGKWGNSVVNTKGSVDIFKGNMDLKGEARLDTAELLSFSSLNIGNDNRIRVSGIQKTDFRLSVSGWIPRISLRSGLNGFSGETDGFLLPPLDNDAFLEMDLSLTGNNEWKLNHFNFMLANGNAAITIPSTLKNINQYSFSLKNFDVGKLGLHHSETGLSFTGKINGDILIKRNAFNDDYPGVFGELNASGTGIKIQGLPLENSGTGRIIFSGQRIYAEKLKIGIGDTLLDVFADLKGWKGITGNIDIKSKNLVLPTIGQGIKSENSFSSFDSEFARNSDLRIDLDIDSGRTSSLNFGQVSANCFFRNGLFDIKNGQIGLNGGELRFRIRQPEEKRGSVKAKAYLKLDDQNLRETFSYFGAEKYLSKLDNAKMSSDAFIYCSGYNFKEMISTMGGYLSLKLEDGVVKKSSILFSILSMLNMEKILHERPEGISREGFYFNSLNAGFKIKDGVFTTRDLVMNSPTVNMGATGDIDFNRKIMDMDVVAAPLVTIDSLVSSLPFVGYILTGNDRALLSYYFKVKGQLDSPETSYVPLKNIPASLFGYLQRIFLTPGRIPEEFRDMKDKIMDTE